VEVKEMSKKIKAMLIASFLIAGFVSQAFGSGPWDSERNRYADSFWWGGETEIRLINPTTGDTLLLSPTYFLITDGTDSTWANKDTVSTHISISDTLVTGWVLAYMVVETDTLKTWEDPQITVLDIMVHVYDVILDSTGAAGESPRLILQDGDGKQLVLQKLNTGQANIINDEGAIYFMPSNDVDDYLTVTTTSNVVEIGTASGGGDGDLELDPAGGHILPGGDNEDTFGRADTRLADGFFNKISLGDTTTGDADAIIYFADDASAVAETLMWDDGLDAFSLSDEFVQPTATPVIILSDTDINTDVTTQAEMADSAAVHAYTEADGDGRIDIVAKDGDELQLYHDGTDTKIISSSGDIILDPAGNNVLPGSDDADTFGRPDTRWADSYSNRISLGDTTTGDADAIIYFADDASATAESFMWDDSEDLFNLSDDLDVDSTIVVGTHLLPDSDEGAAIGQDGNRFTITFTDTLALGDTTWGDHDALIVAAGDGDYALHTWGYDDGEDAWHTTDNVKYPAIEKSYSDSAVVLDYFQLQCDMIFNAATYKIGDASNPVDSLFVNHVVVDSSVVADSLNARFAVFDSVDVGFVMADSMVVDSLDVRYAVFDSVKADVGNFSFVTADSMVVDSLDVRYAVFDSVRIVGDLTVLGDDILATTNTLGAIWVGDNMNYNPVVVSGDVSIVADGTVSITADSVGSAEIKTGAVGDDEIDYANVTLADFDYESNWKMWHSDGSGDVTELALGANGTFLESNAVDGAPAFRALTSDDLSDVASIAMLDEAETLTNNWTFNSGTNAQCDSVLLTAAADSIVVSNTMVTSQSYILLTPIDVAPVGHLIVKHRDTGTFTIWSSGNETVDVPVTYFIIKP